MFHWVRGIPFEFNAGAYDNLNMWEQIDNGDQYTPTKKFLLCVPIVLFLLSTHYTHYDLTYFTINFLATLGVVIPKLPFVCFVCDILVRAILTLYSPTGCDLVSSPPYRRNHSVSLSFVLVPWRRDLYLVSVLPCHTKLVS